MRAISIQSGSNGNCIYVDTGCARILFDAGVSGVCAERRLAEYGIDIRDVNALFVSHDHHDHVRSAGIFNRKFGIPVHMTPKTYEAADRKTKLGRIEGLHTFQAGDSIELHGAVVETIPTPHDGVDGVAFVIESQGMRIGILTDLGHVFDGLSAVVSELDAVFLESNYDPQMLSQGAYPPVLKKRISGPEGHISNEQCAVLLSGSLGRLQWACLSHLSENNNTPQKAYRTARDHLPEDFAVHVADRHCASPVWEILR